MAVGRGSLLPGPYEHLQLSTRQKINTSLTMISFSVFSRTYHGEMCTDKMAMLWVSIDGPLCERTRSKAKTPPAWAVMALFRLVIHGPTQGSSYLYVHLDDFEFLT